MTDEPRSLDPHPPSRRDPVVMSLLAMRVLVLVLVIVNVPHFRSPEADRMREIVATTGRLYRDVPLEYPIGDIPLIRLIGSSSDDVARILLALIAFTADLVVFGALLRAWGATTAKRYLWYGAPLLVFIYRRSDLVVVALAVAGLASVRRDRARAGGVSLGLAVLVKVWPLAVAPVLVLEQRSRAIAAFALTAAAGSAVWIVWGGTSGVRQVLSFRSANGWELESSVGAMVWALTGTFRFEAGANRTGQIPGWSHAVAPILLLGGLVLIWQRARARPVDPAGGPSLAATAFLLVLSPVLSPQYLCWVVPWAAVAAADVPGVRRPAVAAICVTGALVAAWYLGLTHGHPGWSQATLIARNVLLLAVPLAWLLTTRRSSALDTMVPG